MSTEISKLIECEKPHPQCNDGKWFYYEISQGGEVVITGHRQAECELHIINFLAPSLDLANGRVFRDDDLGVDNTHLECDYIDKLLEDNL